MIARGRNVSESTLSLSMNDLTGEAASFLGWGRDPARWSARKLEDLNAVLATALRRFYFQAGHEWSFLKPFATLHLIAGEKTVPLPDDFGGFEGDAMISLAGSSGGYWPVRQVPGEWIRAQYAMANTANGRPRGFADEPTKPNELHSSRNNLLVYPLPDNSYKFECAYSILPEFLTERNPWPYGGAGHAETLKAGIRAAAELFEDAQAGDESANYEQALAASVKYDRRNQPKSLGVNSDRSDMPRGGVGGMWPDGLWTAWGVGYLGPVTYS